MAMDGHSPASLFSVLTGRDPTQLALLIARNLPDLQPCDVPTLPVLSDALAELVHARTPSSVPEHLREEHDAWTAAVLARSNAKGENVRRLRAGLWAEQCLRMRDRPEHARLRAFHREAWGLTEPAASDMTARDLQVAAHA